MLNDPHYPSPKSVALVFFVIFLLMAGVFVWAFYLNYGTAVLSADQPFTVAVNGNDYDCSIKTCRIDLPPQSYEFNARSQDYYDQTFRLDLTRNREKNYAVDFELIPFLKDYPEKNLPPVPDLGYSFQAGEKKGVLKLVRMSDQALITSFDSLKNPSLQVAGSLALVVDTGRVFFVNLADGSKLRRFDDSIEIFDAKLSDTGNRVLLFVRVKQNGADGAADNVKEQLWVWHQDTQELRPMSWYEPPERISWDIGVDHRVFVITDQFHVQEKDSLMEQVLNTPGLAAPELLLYRYNLDTDEKKEIESVDVSLAKALIRRGERFFVEMNDGVIKELVVR